VYNTFCLIFKEIATKLPLKNKRNGTNAFLDPIAARRDDDRRASSIVFQISVFSANEERR